MGMIEVVPCAANPLEIEYTQLTTRFDPEYGILWSMMNPEGVPCFSQKFIDEVILYQNSIEESGGSIWMDGKRHPIRYSIAHSRIPGVFNLGGDLALFSSLIRKGDRQALMQYATRCIDISMPRVNHYNLPLITISLIQGDALGGGLESALTSDVIIAERSSKMGFPEILFNLIPGMGAYSLVSRKIGVALAEEMILSGKMYSAEELYAIGLVNVLVEDGAGKDAVYDYVRKQSRRSNGYLAMQRVRQRFNPVTYQELMDITTIWVDAAMQLGESDLKIMDRIMRSQQKRFVKNEKIYLTNPVSQELSMAHIYFGASDRRKIPRIQYA